MRTIANVRKGTAQDQEKTSGWRGGDNLGHRMRVEFNDRDNDSAELAARFVQHYQSSALNLHAKNPLSLIVTEIPFILPIHWRDLYHYSVQAHLSYPVAISNEEGDQWVFMRDPQSMRVLIYDGIVKEQHTDLEGRIWEVGATRPVEYGQPIAIVRDKPLIPEGKMTLEILPYFLQKLVTFQIVSTSGNDAREVRKMLEELDQLCQNIGFHRGLIGQKLVLRRREREFTRQTPQGASRDEDWFLSIEPSAELDEIIAGAFDHA